jgi:hypothetical protein
VCSWYLLLTMLQCFEVINRVAFNVGLPLNLNSSEQQTAQGYQEYLPPLMLPALPVWHKKKYAVPITLTGNLTDTSVLLPPLLLHQ